MQSSSSHHLSCNIHHLLICSSSPCNLLFVTLHDFNFYRFTSDGLSSRLHLPQKLHHRGLSSGSVCYASDRTDTQSAIVVLSVDKVIYKHSFFIDDISNTIATTNHCIIGRNNNHRRLFNAGVSNTVFIIDH
ncbi:hypothetical protein L6452_34509 [Arctium lappa]|uniref:Uncharacterized protein n=1 Tax=Arctium lappa TaxID=4217 RepID=A0ACB8YJZ1_ARCLA|nr:hypothetical protein L6452_34509 [Arctium lappa]